MSEIWSGESYIRHAPDEQHVDEAMGFIRFDASGAARKARLAHLLIEPSQHPKETVFEWTGSQLVSVR